MMYSRIAGTGRYLPERVLSNRELESMVDTTEEWIRTRTGIERRHIAADDQATSDLAEQAALQAMAAAGVTPADIDFLVVGTTTPDLVFPNVGCLVQRKLGIHGCAAFSLEAACSGFIYALTMADRFVASGLAKCALVIGAETLSRIVDWNDRATCVLFGDGAGAVVLKPAAEPGILSCHLGADGHYSDLLYHPYGTSRPQRPADTERPFMQMKGNEVFKVAVKTTSRRFIFHRLGPAHPSGPLRRAPRDYEVAWVRRVAQAPTVAERDHLGRPAGETPALRRCRHLARQQWQDAPLPSSAASRPAAVRAFEPELRSRKGMRSHESGEGNEGMN